jgi:hypothetical protein
MEDQVQQHKFPAYLARRACPVGRRYRSPRTARYGVSDCFPERVRLGEAVSGEGFSGTQCHLAQRWEIISG